MNANDEAAARACPLRVTVVGPGAIGGLLAAVLARAGATVTCVGRPETTAALTNAGLRLRSRLLGDFAAEVVVASEVPARQDVVFFTVKAPALASAVAAAPAATVGGALVVPLLNGVEHLVILRQTYGPENVVAGTIRAEAARVSAGRIEHYTPFADLQFATHAAPDKTLLDVSATLRQAGLSVVTRDNPMGMLWDKLAFLTPFALSTARLGASIGAVREMARVGLHLLVEETVPVARANGSDATVQGVTKFLDNLPSTMSSSLRRDVEAGVATELDAIGGAVVRAAARLGLPAPAVEEYMNAVAARTTTLATELAVR
ncbi:MAG: 2-dehydropantoate 2-reductase [Mycobacterium sp.]|nr:2-dehydropantoate 2-reductase [Mycobacterium sp.]